MTEYVIYFLIIVVVVMAITGVAEWVSHRIEDPFVRKEIIRCCDCRYYSPYQDLCERLQPGMLVLEPDDGFCAWGEREDGDAR